MAPLLGQAVRNLYGRLGNGLDVGVARKAAEWFSVHLSNFAFQWMWKAWSVSRHRINYRCLAEGYLRIIRIPDLELPMTHPKRAFMHRIIELEIRLAYQERIMETLPKEMQDESDAPALQLGLSSFAYEEEGQSLCNSRTALFRRSDSLRFDRPP